ncbi:MAG: deoxynucleoside kinase [Oscillospiraceae bacterium]|nr:deoxynucleoside kinase [Oscillospiraceae bacterium]
MPGKLIVFEGTDGSGKSTQFDLLCRRLLAEGRPFQHIVFPQYDKPSSTLLRMYLKGEFGNRPGDVNAYAASTFYAVDRFASFRQSWGDPWREGLLTLSDRYTTSNAVHQAAKLPPEQRGAYFDWLDDFEYAKLGLPRPDLVLYLDMPVRRAVENLRRRERETATQGDIHEVDEGYLALCHETADQAADHYGWRRVVCTDPVGALRPAEQLHEEIWNILLEVL